MVAAVRVTITMVREAIADLRRNGVAVTYLGGRVVGLRSLREQTGGCAERVRAMSILILAEESMQVGSAETRAAKATLRAGGRAERAAQRGSTIERRIVEALADILATVHWTSSSSPAASKFSHNVPDHMRPEPKVSRLQAPVVSRPAGGDGGAALVGAEQNAPLGSVGRLSALRDQRMALLQAAEDEFDPYNLETVERWRAAGRSSEE